MKFTKMHGIGNDYVYVNCFDETVADPSRIAPLVSDRHTGIGGDGLILIMPSQKADVRMRMFNADGLEGEMCGNGIRCVAKYAWDHGLAKKNPMRIETGRGILSLQLMVVDEKVQEVTVNMGPPILKLAEIPVDREQVAAQHEAHEYVYRVSRPATIDEMVYAGKRGDQVQAVLKSTFVSMGNPHTVTFVEDVAAVPLAVLGPLVEHGKAFPRRINAHWAQVQSRNEITMRTWERGSGITLACGTGACAVCVAGILTGRTDRRILAHLPGGDLNIEWRESDNNVYMTGPATEVFSGEWRV
jgi:diaminopimelate epimerase